MYVVLNRTNKNNKKLVLLNIVNTRRILMSKRVFNRTVYTPNTKICYGNPGNMPNKGRKFNTQTFEKMYVFICYLYD